MGREQRFQAREPAAALLLNRVMVLPVRLAGGEALWAAPAWAQVRKKEGDPDSGVQECGLDNPA